MLVLMMIIIIIIIIIQSSAQSGSYTEGKQSSAVCSLSLHSLLTPYQGKRAASLPACTAEPALSLEAPRKRYILMCTWQHNSRCTGSLQKSNFHRRLGGVKHAVHTARSIIENPLQKTDKASKTGKQHLSFVRLLSLDETCSATQSYMQRAQCGIIQEHAFNSVGTPKYEYDSRSISQLVGFGLSEYVFQDWAPWMISRIQTPTQRLLFGSGDCVESSTSHKLRA